MSKRDDINLMYSYSNYLEICCNILFWINFACSFGIVILNNISTIISLIQIISTILYVVLKSIDEGCLWYDAEKARRRNNMQNAFNVHLSDMETEGFYNNSLKPSIVKYAVNTFESNFFSKCIAGKMLVKSTFKSILAIVVLIITERIVSSGDLLLLILQTVFSTYVIEDTIRLAIYKFRMNKIYDEAFTELVTLGVKGRKHATWMLSYVVEYEAIKAHYKVRLDSKLFYKHNDALSKKWDAIQKKIVTKR